MCECRHGGGVDRVGVVGDDRYNLWFVGGFGGGSVFSVPAGVFGCLRRYFTRVENEICQPKTDGKKSCHEFRATTSPETAPSPNQKTNEAKDKETKGQKRGPHQQ